MSAMPMTPFDSHSTETGWTAHEVSALGDSYGLDDQSPILDAILNYLDTLPVDEST